MKNRLTGFALAAAITVLALVACGEDGAETTIQGRDLTEIPGGADPEAVEVVDEWATALAAGNVSKAASYFAIPSIAENGPSVVQIRDRGDALLFNGSLPCGAELLRAQQRGRFVVATFRLGERPGPGTCGAGTGARAKTAFRIEGGKIVEWRRVLTGGEQRGQPIPSDVV